VRVHEDPRNGVRGGRDSARTGSPSQPDLEWKPYTKENPQAMVFDTVSQSVPLADDKLVSLLPAGGGRGSTALTPRSPAAAGGRG